MNNFSPYHRCGRIAKQPDLKIEKLADFGWIDTGRDIDGRPIFRLIGHSAALYRSNGGFIVDVGRGLSKFFPAGTPLAEVTDWAKQMTTDYIVIESADGTTCVNRAGQMRLVERSLQDRPLLVRAT